ncbi:DUF6794 domain-containing protein [Methylotuvimicrobium sp. KM2]|uniref:DUF6794 domain-containing protein n=1 Tax=Methylotuvimicrobium sp. KM2 TaxID=3133976 RepID=UPI0031019D0F
MKSKRKAAESDLTDLHFGLGAAVRNAFGLHEPGSILFSSCGTSYPNDAFGVISLELWRKLQDGSPTIS